MTLEDYRLLEIAMGNFVTIISSSRQDSIKGPRVRMMNLTVAEWYYAVKDMDAHLVQ